MCCVAAQVLNSCEYREWLYSPDRLWRAQLVPIPTRVPFESPTPIAFFSGVTIPTILIWSFPTTPFLIHWMRVLYHPLDLSHFLSYTLYGTFLRSSSFYSFLPKVGTPSILPLRFSLSDDLRYEFNKEDFQIMIC
jgi:hypothetical protein